MFFYSNVQSKIDDQTWLGVSSVGDVWEAPLLINYVNISKVNSASQICCIVLLFVCTYCLVEGKHG